MKKILFLIVCMTLLCVFCSAFSESLLPQPGEAPTVPSFAATVGRAEVVPVRKDDTMAYDYASVTAEEYTAFGVRLSKEGYMLNSTFGNKAMLTLSVSKDGNSFTIEYSESSKTLSVYYPLTVLPEKSATQSVVPSPNPEESPAADETVAESSSFQIGDTVLFGFYVQSGEKDASAESIEWIVLDVQDGKMLLLSKYILDVQKYHKGWDKVMTWEKCSLRKWLNSTFLNAAFTPEEQQHILLTVVKAEANPENPTVKPGNDTQDLVFLLSYSEAEAYFPEEANRIARATAYAIAQGINQTEGNGPWWLRTPGSSGSRAAVATDNGAFSRNDINYAHNGIRPAVWVDFISE